MKPRHLSIVAGVSYLIIFFTAIYANFFVIESLIADPLGTVSDSAQHIRFGVLAFLVAAVCDVVVAWALYELYKDNILSRLSTYFRIIHATIMGTAVFALMQILTLPDLTDESVIHSLVDTFNTIWLIGLFFFGFHLILLGRIVKEIRLIPLILTLAGIMYIIDTAAHFALPTYDVYADIFLILVAIPAVLGEMSFSVWLLWRGERITR